MVIEYRENLEREPVHPGLILEDYMEAKGWNQTEFAKLLGMSRPHLNEIINGKRGISPRTAVKLAIAFETTETFWKNLDTRRQLWEARQEEPDELEALKDRLEAKTSKEVA